MILFFDKYACTRRLFWVDEATPSPLGRIDHVPTYNTAYPLTISLDSGVSSSSVRSFTSSAYFFFIVYLFNSVIFFITIVFSSEEKSKLQLSALNVNLYYAIAMLE